jgi:hypothetical protein
MIAPNLLKPTLYRAEGSDADPDHPALLGGTCECGYVFFPPQSYGCERCGRTSLVTRALSGTGKLLASARVHLHGGKTRAAPFTIVSVMLDDGPIVRTLLAGDDAVHPGDRMLTMLVPVTNAEGVELLDLRFVPQR